MDLDDLYGLPLDRFVPERASLVRELRSGGEREQAAVIAALRKPSVAAWAVNQLIRTQRHELDELCATGDALRDIQAGVLGGSADARDLRSAAERERAAVAALVDSARDLLSSGGHELSATTLERVSETLHAAALDDEARRQVTEGRLVRELRHVGLGAGLGGAIAAPPARPARPTRGATPKPAPGRSAEPARGGRDSGPAKARDAEAERQAVKKRKAAEAAERREREEARKQARAVERDAAREADRAERAVRTAQERQARAADALRQAEAAVQEAEAGLDAAIAAHRQARQQLDNV